ncbi:Alpha/Beta hydrolase protein [Schizophyllum amplum]|uniref:Alpha/Beta hydrolase protein n=1 Tax=Schizophyllum amplum TaxID=97359 RepID=A0A550CVC0_9AGAR|nr:Alpha/Beta hydrolase protein [Auriculariopsis ampla]
MRLSAAVWVSLLAVVAATEDFNPRSYSKQRTTCKAAKRDEGDKVVDITMSYVDVNPGAKHTLLLVHGWPSLWTTWSYQIKEFENDYRLIAPDHRGFGESTHPGDVQSSGTLQDLVGDMVCVLEDAGVTTATCVGHDWGSAVCYEAARSRPDIFTAVVGAAVPYMPAAGDAFTPVAALVPLLPKLAYNVFFAENTSIAVAELNQDVRRTLRGTLRQKSSPPPDDFLTYTDTFIGAWKDYAEIPPIPFFTADEEEYFVEQFSLQKFDNTLQFYTNPNRLAAWELAHNQGNLTIPQPALSILPSEDPVADWVKAAALLHSADFLPNLKTTVVTGSHWFHLENAVDFNRELRAWLEETLESASGTTKEHFVDEF